MKRSDVIVIGAGHNGLTAAIFLARAGLTVRVLEAKDAVGGAAKTETPFAAAPNLRHSTGAYLLGLMPPELAAKLGRDFPTVRRDPHYFLPTTSGRYLLFGSDDAAMKAQFLEFFSEQDWRADRELQDELRQLRDDVGPAWMREPLSIEETAEAYVRPRLRQAFVDLCRGSVGDYLARFDFRSELIQAMYAVTDGFSGSSGGWDTPGSGHNFLVHNMTRLADADGTWMVVEGGMGRVSAILAEEAQRAGVELLTSTPVRSVEVERQTVRAVVTEDDTRYEAEVIVSGADPWSLMDAVGAEQYSSDYRSWLDDRERPGTTFKLNLALSDLPTFSCLPERRGQHNGTMHLLPETNVIDRVKKAHADALSGQLPEFPTIEWYIHTPVDPSLQDDAGRHSSALFVQWVPFAPEAGAGEWSESLTEEYSRHLLSICDRFAPGTSELVVDTFPLHPPGIRDYFGIQPSGHIHHIDNIFGFADRHPYRTEIAGLYCCSAACHPAGSVIGASGHNAAMRILDDLNVEEPS